MRKLVIATALFGISLSPVFAQTMQPGNENKPAGEELSRADCQANFKKADVDGNGTLSVEEVETSQSVIPTTLAMSGPITQAEFLTACTANISKGG